MSENNVICETRTYTEKMQTHSHPYGQLILPLQGTLSIKTTDTDLNLDDRHLFFLPSQCDHSYASRDRNTSLVLDIPSHLGGLLRGDTRGRTMRRILDEKWKAIRFLLLEEAHSKNGDNLRNLVHYICGFLTEDVKPASVQYIHDNFQNEIHIKQLAEIESFNLSYYIKWFQKETGMTPNAYIQMLRLEKAKEYLCETDLSLLVISELVGYKQQSSFTRLFTSREGISPSAYRKKYRISAKSFSI